MAVAVGGYPPSDHPQPIHHSPGLNCVRAARLAKGELAALLVDYLSAHPGELGPTEPGIISADATRTVVRVAG